METPNKTREPQYQFLLEESEYSFSKFGLMSAQVWRDDPKRLAFMLARYKFVAKMLTGKEKVLEVGCADGFGTRLVLQEVSSVTATDFDPIFINNASACSDRKWKINFVVHDMLERPYPTVFDAAYALDVIEHIAPESEARFIGNMVDSINPNGIVVIGCPSLQSQIYASPPSREGHVNCKDGLGLRKLLEGFFHNVFLFSMNDEVVHTGFSQMAHYLIAIGSTKK